MSTRLKKLLTNDFVIGLFLLGVFLATNGYTYAWDDQHLEIPLLKSLINHSLYPGDYYVEGLKNNFATLFFPLLAKVISVDQVPAAYLVLFLISRYFLFFWIYKLWKLITNRIAPAIYATLMIILLLRVEEFLYRTFSHQEFALAIIVAGIYYFYKERFLLAALLLGLAANFHALYSLFPFLYMAGYLLWQKKQHGLAVLLKSGLAFFLGALPFLITVGAKYLKAEAGPAPATSEWISLYLIACPQNFVFYTHTFKEMFSSFPAFVDITKDYWKLFFFFLLNYFFNPLFRQDKKAQSFLWVGTALLIFSMIFSHIFPTRFVLDLNLVRNTQYMLFVFAGYTTLLLLSCFERGRLLTALLLALAFPLMRFGDYVQIYTILFMLAVLVYFQKNFLTMHAGGLGESLSPRPGGCSASAASAEGDRATNKEPCLSRPARSEPGRRGLAPLAEVRSPYRNLSDGALATDRAVNIRGRMRQKIITAVAGISALVFAVLIAQQFSQKHFSHQALLAMGIMLGLAGLTYGLAQIFRRKPELSFFLRQLFLVFPFLVLFVSFVLYHINHLTIERTGAGFWQVQRNWIDMQEYVKKNTPVRALLLVPYDTEMGGFRILSERSIVVCYRDCGIIGFDYPAMVEWQKRINDVEPFKVMITGPITSAVMNAILKYKVNYIVFMKYTNPGQSPVLQLVYENEVFVLYKVLINRE